MVYEQFDDLEVTVVAGGPQRRGVGARCAVDARPVAQQQVHQRIVAGGRGTPQGWGTFDGLPVEHNWNTTSAPLSSARAAPVQHTAGGWPSRGQADRRGVTYGTCLTNLGGVPSRTIQADILMPRA